MIGNGPPNRIGDWRIDSRTDESTEWRSESGYGKAAVAVIEETSNGWIGHARSIPAHASDSKMTAIISSQEPVSNREDAQMILRQWLRDHPSWPGNASQSGFGIGL